MNRIDLYVDNVPVGGNPLKLNFDDSIGQTTLPAYNSMFDVTGKWLQDSGNQLDRSDIANGYALYCFDLEPQIASHGDYLTLLKQGNTRIEAQFNKALPTTVTCIAYATFPALFKITSSRDIIVE